jgi:hypothetical protein
VCAKFWEGTYNCCKKYWLSGKLQSPTVDMMGSFNGCVAPGSHYTGGWVGPRAGLDIMEKRKISCLSEIEPQTLGRPAHSLVVILVLSLCTQF